MSQQSVAQPPVAYTSRDYLSIREDLLNTIPQYLPTWVSRSPNDFGVVLLELFAYVADNLHYYTDRLANEAYISTATQRSSVINLAYMLGYRPSSTFAAQTNLQFTNSTTAAIIIPARTTIVTSLNQITTTPVSFETDSDVSIPTSGSAVVSAHQGKSILSESVATSDGSIVQTYSLFQTPVIQGSVQIYVDEGSGPVQWSFVTNMLIAGPYDSVYTLNIDAVGTIYVEFGDGANGRIPAPGSPISANYRVGGGLVGNVGAGTLINIASNVPPGITVTNPQGALGGADAESTDSIRSNAVANVSTLSRAVTLSDYAKLAVTVGGVAKASAVSRATNSVQVYLAPAGGGGLDSSGVATAPFVALKNTVLSYLNTVKLATTSVSVLDPVYVPINISVVLHLSNQYQQSRAIQDATTVLSTLLAFDNVLFGDQITPGDVHLALSSVVGVAWSDVTTLASSISGATTAATVSLASNQIPTPGSISVTAVGGIV